jgi:hypothetical protein
VGQGGRRRPGGRSTSAGQEQRRGRAVVVVGAGGGGVAGAGRQPTQLAVVDVLHVRGVVVIGEGPRPDPRSRPGITHTTLRSRGTVELVVHPALGPRQVEVGGSSGNHWWPTTARPDQAVARDRGPGDGRASSSASGSRSRPGPPTARPPSALFLAPPGGVGPARRWSASSAARSRGSRSPRRSPPRPPAVSRSATARSIARSAGRRGPAERWRARAADDARSTNGRRDRPTPAGVARLGRERRAPGGAPRVEELADVVARLVVVGEAALDRAPGRGARRPAATARSAADRGAGRDQRSVAELARRRRAVGQREDQGADATPPIARRPSSPARPGDSRSGPPPKDGARRGGDRCAIGGSARRGPGGSRWSRPGRCARSACRRARAAPGRWRTARRRPRRRSRARA